MIAATACLNQSLAAKNTGKAQCQTPINRDSKVIPERRHNRHIKPRKCDYSNELYGKRDADEKDFEPHPKDDASYTDDPELESKVIARGTSKLGPLEADDAWKSTPAYYMLCNEPNTGIWIPRLVGKAIGNQNRARLLSHLLWWFDDETSRAGTYGGHNNDARGPERVYRGFHGLCRARARDEEGNRCLGTSLQDLRKDLNLSDQVIKRGLTWLIEEKIVAARTIGSGEYKGRYLISLIAEGLARKYYHATADPVAFDEFLSDTPTFNAYPQQLQNLSSPSNGFGFDEECDDSPRGWFESETRQRAMNRFPIYDHRTESHRPIARGTWVSDRVYFACEKKAGPAWLLSQILFWFDDRKKKDGKRQGSRARIVREGHLWIAKSHRELHSETGIPERSIRDYVKYLSEDRGFLVKGKWVYDRKRDRNQKMLHLRRDPEKLNESLTSIEVDDAVSEMEKRRLSD